MNASEGQWQTQIVRRLLLNGCGFGITTPTWVVEFAAPRSAVADLPRLDRAIADLAGRAVSLPPGCAASRCLVTRAASFAVAIARSAGLAVFDPPRLLVEATSASDRVILAMPALPMQEQQGEGLLEWSLATVNRLAAIPAPEELLGELRQSLDQQIRALARFRVPGTNNLRFLEAARKADIPWRFVGGYCQYGWGRHLVRSRSSIFDTTGSIAVGTARDKLACTAVLREAGLPVPANGLAPSEDAAVAQARRLGYPVVIKPVTLDGGVGVFAGITSEDALRRAWQSAAALGQPVMVEKHQPGEDIRLIVLDGELVWAVGRRPASVEGDGASTVEDLVLRANRDPRRGFHADATLRPLVLDDEAVAVLSDQGVFASTVLRRGQVAFLRRAANLSSGGEPVAVTGKVHPDNRALAENAARLLKLDVAGLDLIIPDIAVSWRQSGGAIIEVNAQPQLVASSQNHLYGHILARRVRGNGRVPVVLVVGEMTGDLSWQVRGQASREGLRGVGVACASGLHIDNRLFAPGRGDPVVDGRALLMNPAVAAMIQFADIAALQRRGLAFDRFDHLVLAQCDHEPTSGWQTFLAMIMPHCRNGASAVGEPVSAALRTSAAAMKIKLEERSSSGLAEHIVSLLRPAQVAPR